MRLLMASIFVFVFDSWSTAADFSIVVKTSQGREINLASPSLSTFRLVFWYSNFCPPCWMMKTYFSDIERACSGSKLEIIRVNLDDNSNLKTSKKFGAYGTPTISILDSQGSVLVQKTGFITEENLRQVISSFSQCK